MTVFLPNLYWSILLIIVIEIDHTMNRIYYGCMFKNAVGTNRIIAAGEICLITTSKCFWKDSCNVGHVQKSSQVYTIKTLTTTCRKENGSMDGYLKKNKKQLVLLWLCLA